MTNLVATLVVVLATNWVTVSRTTPILGNPLWAVHVESTDNQVGVVVTNYLARVIYKGTTNEFLLESVRSETQPANLGRSIPSPSQLGNLMISQ